MRSSLRLHLMERASSLFCTLFGVIVGVLSNAAFVGRAEADELPKAASPNVLVILSDDQGWGDLSLNGNANLSTLSIDSLAKTGASFDRFYVCPVCSPTRAEFLTGRYHPRSGVFSTSAGGERMDLDERTVADAFRAAGYRTAAFGKWHNGMQFPYHPMGRGFDEFYGFCSGHWGNYFSPMLESNGRIVKGNGFCVDDFTDHAIQFMESSVQQGIPFFAYLPLNTPHSPMQVPDRFWKKFENADLAQRHRDPKREDLGHTRAALAMCENIDWNVGRLLEKLEQWNIAEETIVVYFCDNGPNGSRWNGGMKGRKGSTDEGGVRSPLLIRWPGKIPPGKQIVPIAAAIDLLPTLVDLANIKLSPNKPLDGKSLTPLLLDATPDWPDRNIISHWNGKVSVRNQRFRLDSRGELFDLTKDPGQHENVAKQFPEHARRLKATADQYRGEVLSELDRDEHRPFVVGHPEFKITQLPARDANATGDVTRSNRFPNCSFFTNWNQRGEEIFWDADVPAARDTAAGETSAGDFTAEIYYTCPPASVGTEIELVWQPASPGVSAAEEPQATVLARCQVTESWDPPQIGASEDRVPRGESYVKDFRPLAVDRFTLPTGLGTLRLRISETPDPAGEPSGVDFRLLLLTRTE